MHVLIFGGTGFVGLNIAAAFHTGGHRVSLFDKSPPPAGFDVPAACHLGDVRNKTAVRAAMASAPDIVICGAAITAGSAREARDPDSILSVNLGALPGILESGRDAGVKRFVNLSSAAAYGAAPGPRLAEDDAASPESLYAITKFASERVAARLAGHWRLDVVNVRLSAVFGPWERDTGERDTLSAPGQILALAADGTPALLPRPGIRDWIYAPDVAEAVRTIALAPRLGHALYNISTGNSWSALDWGQALARHLPGLVCRIAGPGETAIVDLHAPTDRPPLATDRLAADLGWRARFDLETSARHLAAWWSTHKESSTT